jgi:uncharacterized protein YqeY
LEEEMTLQQQLQIDLTVAMKARDQQRTAAIRILIGEFARQRQKQIPDDQVVHIIKKLIKSERELLAAQGKQHSSFMRIMAGYLPDQASEEEIRLYIEKNIDFSSYKNRMQAMKPIMEHFGSRVDGNRVKKVLGSFA